MSDKELEEILNEFSSNRNRASAEAPKKPREEIRFEGFDTPKREEPAEKEKLELSFENFVEAPVVHPGQEGIVGQEVDEDEAIEDADKSKKPNKKLIIAIIAVALVIALGVGIFFAAHKPKDDTKPETTQAQQAEDVAPVVQTPKNPFTGVDGYNEAAIGKRPVAVVVENEYSTASVRPQWAIADADIVLEGESEYSTRLLMFWADYTAVPDKVGPARSARPPFIRFSQLFDSIFIHAGLSHTKGDYVGADSVFESDNVDHVNLLAGDGFGYFDRDYSRTRTVEHTGYLIGSAVPELISKKGFRTDVNQNKFSVLSFNDEAQALSDIPCKKVEFKWTNGGNCPKKGTYFYDETTKTYKTTDFDSQYGESNVSWQNLIFLLDTTQYVVKENYKGGNSETYCNYKLTGGKGAVLSQGTYIDITWGVENGKLWMKDASGNEVKLNPGKSYIGYGSQNYNGSITIVE